MSRGVHRYSDSSGLKHLRDYGRSMSDVDHPWKLTEKCVENAWFLYTLVYFFCDSNQFDSISFATNSSPSQRKDLDFLCDQAWEVISQATNPWIHHKCHILGCSEGMLLSFPCFCVIQQISYNIIKIYA